MNVHCLPKMTLLRRNKISPSAQFLKDEDRTKTRLPGSISIHLILASRWLLLCFQSEASVCLPSGTEPKVKFYFAVKGSSLEDSEQRLASLSEDVMKTVDEIVESTAK